MVKPSASIIADVSWINTSGTGRYALETLGYLKRYFGKQLQTIQTNSPASASSPFRLSLALRGLRRGVFWTPQYMLPLYSGIPCAVTIHDLLQVHYGAPHKRLYFERVLKPLYRRAAKVITVSEFSRREISEWTRIPIHKISVVANGVGAQFSPKARSRYCAHVCPFPYLLYIGNRRHHKNLQRMLEGFAEACIPGDVKIVLSGDASEQLIRLANRLGIGHRIHFAGHIEEALLPAWYASAIAVVNVSLYEGFGLPVLEGMASGVPVVAANCGALPEVAGDAAVFVDPCNVADIARGITCATSNGSVRQTCVGKGLKRASQFRWEDSAKTLINELNNILES